jgi:integrase
VLADFLILLGLDAFGIAHNALRVRNAKLGGYVGNDSHRHIHRIGEKGAQESERADLHSKAQTIVIATALGNSPRIPARMVLISGISPKSDASDLAQLCAFHQGPVQTITAEVLRKFFGKIERVKLDPPQPRGVERSQIERILTIIPASHLRDRLFFRLLAGTGLRVSEGLSLYVEDLDLSLDNEHLTVVGKGGKRRTVLLDDPRLLQQPRIYLKRMGYQHGPLFRAEKNGRGGPLRYQSMQERWDSYCSQAVVACTLHQLRHAHATELINGG